MIFWQYIYLTFCVVDFNYIVEKSDCTFSRVTLHHLVVWLEATPGDLVHTELLMVSLVATGHRAVGGQGVVNTRVGHQVGLELIEVNIQSPVKPEAGRDGGDDLGNEPVEVGVGGTLHSEVVLAEIVDGLVVH